MWLDANAVSAIIFSDNFLGLSGVALTHNGA